MREAVAASLLVVAAGAAAGARAVGRAAFAPRFIAVRPAMRQTKSLLLMVALLCAGGAYAQSFEDDGETGGVLKTDSPAGRWDWRGTLSGSSFLSSTAAAHRGLRGFRADDATTGSTPDYQTYINTTLSTPATSQFHYRFWMRISTSNGIGSGLVGSVRSAVQDLVNLEYDATDGSLTVGGFNDGPNWVGGPATGTLNVGSWHLVEFSVRGVGTTSGTKEVYIDGIQVFLLSGIDWSSWDVRRIFLGEFWSNSPAFEGRIDYDDIRAATTEHASSIAVGLPGAAVESTCVEVTLTMKSSNGLVQNAPYAFPAELAAAGAGGSFYSDAACQVPVITAPFAAGTSTASVYFKGAAAGTATVIASFVDFLPGSAPITLTLAQDAGVDAGADGGSDAGGDNPGVPDGGATDAGFAPDAGTKPDAGGLEGPVARVEPAESTVAAGELVTLDSSKSTAPPGTFVKSRTWRLVEGPSFLEIAGDTSATLKPQTPGVYVVELTVTDTIDRTSAPVRARVTVEGEVFHPPEELGGCGCATAGTTTALTWAIALLLARSTARRRTGRTGDGAGGIAALHDNSDG